MSVSVTRTALHTDPETFHSELKKEVEETLTNALHSSTEVPTKPQQLRNSFLISDGPFRTNVSVEEPLVNGHSVRGSQIFTVLAHLCGFWKLQYLEVEPLLGSYIHTVPYHCCALHVITPLVRIQYVKLLETSCHE